MTRLGDRVWVFKEDDGCRKTFGEFCGIGGTLTGVYINHGVSFIQLFEKKKKWLPLSKH